MKHNKNIRYDWQLLLLLTLLSMSYTKHHTQWYITQCLWTTSLSPTSIIPSEKDIFRYRLLYQQERKSAGQMLSNNRESTVVEEVMQMSDTV